ncbi:MAG TPA: thiolase family protein [Actinomycetota bacterium]|nr:thiolase family protein [Actinomycetota bacterium]
MERAVIVEGARTPIGRFLGSFADVPAVDLGIAATREALRRANVEPDAVQLAVFGHARQAGNGPNTARQVAYRSGIPQEVPAFTANMACGSGVKAIELAAREIVLGEAEVVVAGGYENMTRTPALLDRLRLGYRMGNAQIFDGMYRDGFLDPLCDLVMGETAENLARRYEIPRRDQDEFALASQQKAASGKERRAKEIVPIEVPGKKGATVTVAEDEHPRPNTDLDTLAKLPPVFSDDGGTVTAGNSSGVTDGAAAVVVMSESRARAEGHQPLARIVASASAGVDPAYMGIGVVPAVQKVLDKTGLSLRDFDVLEINEAFAAQVLAVDRELKLDHDRLNPNGGAIALGHPIGMSGARIVLTAAYELRERGHALALASLCISGGQGMAMVLESAA